MNSAMEWAKDEREAQQRIIRVFSARPEQGRSTVTGTAELRDGLACSFEQDGRRVVADMPATIGGTGTGPSPGFYGRAALCSCVAMGIKMAAIRSNLRVEAIRVNIEQDWDDRGMFEMADAPAGPLAARLTIEVESAAGKESIAALVERALAHDPWLIAYQQAQKVSTTLSLVPVVR